MRFGVEIGDKKKIGDRARTVLYILVPIPEKSPKPKKKKINNQKTKIKNKKTSLLKLGLHKT